MHNQNRVAVIVLDSGFSPSALGRVKNLLGYADLNTGLFLVGQPTVEGDARRFVQSLAVDPLNHGSIILDKLLDMDADLPLILVRAFASDGGLIRTSFAVDGLIAADGWTEAYLWAQNICAQRGYLSVANLSFGGFHHTLDGNGWEYFQLSRVVGAGKPGHLIAAATGPGDGRATHASLRLAGAAGAVIHVHQRGRAGYNLLVDREVGGTQRTQEKPDQKDFVLEVRSAGHTLLTCRGLDLVPNLWNGKQQFTFDLDLGPSFNGEVELSLGMADNAAPARFDVFISRGDGTFFTDFVDDESVSEPALYGNVVAVGLEDGKYGPGPKPDVLLSGPGPISFRTPEVTFALAGMLRSDISGVLDAPAALHRLVSTRVS